LKIEKNVAMIDFPIADAHVHLWDPGRLRYPWLDDLPSLGRPHLPEDYLRACGPVRVEKMVFVQCECDFSQYRQEADWVTALARRETRIAGIVPWAPLEEGEAARGAVAALAANPLVKGIRRIIQYEPDLEFCLREDFVRGVRMLAEFGLSFDLCLAPPQMENTIRLVEQCPGVRFIVDHVAKPNLREGVFEPWRTHLKTLSDFPNVWCKMSGLVTEADHQRWTREQLKPAIDHAIECFGFDRVVFAGDWPVVTLASDYPRWVETLDWAVGNCSPSQRHKLFHDNAVAFYRL
jgi:L-fuconolactonase